MESPFFSILMCVYNNIEFLEKSINSVLQQKEPSFELLILDNSDVNRKQSQEALMEISNRDKRIEIFQNQEN